MNKKTVVIMVAAVILMLASNWYFVTQTQKETIDVFKSYDRVTSSDGSGNVESKWIMFFENEVYENTDSMFMMKFDSSDVVRKLQPGKKYKIKSYGVRVPFLSMYRNIIDVEEVE